MAILIACFIFGMEAVASIPNNEIHYTTSDGKIIEIKPYGNENENMLISNTYENGVGVMVFENDVSNIYDDYFECSETLLTVELPECVTGIFQCSFEKCSNLESINFPESIYFVEEGAFDGCLGLKCIDIPSSLSDLNMYVFNGCTGLTDVYVHWDNPPYNNEFDCFFGETDLSNITLHVPAGTAELYKTTGEWKCFGTVVEEQPNSVSSAKAAEGSSSDSLYNIFGQRIDVAKSGNIIISNGKKYLSK